MDRLIDRWMDGGIHITPQCSKKMANDSLFIMYSWTVYAVYAIFLCCAILYCCPGAHLLCSASHQDAL